MTVAKFIALLVMVAVYAAVDFAVPVKATDFTEGNKFETADTPSVLPVTDDSDDKVRPLPANSTVEVVEERAIPPNLNSNIFESLLSSIHKQRKRPWLTKPWTKWKWKWNKGHSQLKGKMAFDIPPQPPTLTTMDGREVLAYHISGSDMRYTPVSIPLKDLNVGSDYLQHSRDLLLRDEAPGLDKWIGEGVFSKKTAKAILSRRVAGLHLSKGDFTQYAYVLTLNLRDAHIRQSFPRWYSSLSRLSKVGIALRSEFHLSEMELEYYMTEYSIFCKFAEAFYKDRKRARALPELFQLNRAYRDVTSDRRVMENILTRTAEQVKVELSEEVVSRLADHLMYFGEKPV